MVSRKWIGEGNGRRSYKREDAGGRGAGWLRKGFGFKRSPSTRPDQTTTTRTDAAAARWACVGLWAVGGLLAGRLDAAPPTRARSSVLVPPPLAGALHAGWLAALGTSGTLPWRRNWGTGHLVGSWTWQARKGRVRSGPWALSGTSQGGERAGTEEEGASSPSQWFQGYRAPDQLRPGFRDLLSQILLA